MQAGAAAGLTTPNPADGMLAAASTATDPAATPAAPTSAAPDAWRPTARLTDAALQDMGQAGASTAAPGALAAAAGTMAATAPGRPLLEDSSPRAADGRHLVAGRADAHATPGGPANPAAPGIPTATGAAAAFATPASSTALAFVAQASAAPDGATPPSGSAPARHAAQAAPQRFAATPPGDSLAPASGKPNHHDAARATLAATAPTGGHAPQAADGALRSHPATPPNAALLASLAAGAGSLLGATTAAASEAAQLARATSASHGGLPAAAEPPSLSVPPGMAMPGAAGRDVPPAAMPQVEAAATLSAAMPQGEAATALPASGAMAQGAPAMPTSDAMPGDSMSAIGAPGALPTASPAPAVDAAPPATPSLAETSAPPPSFVPGAGAADLPQGAGLPDTQSAPAAGLTGIGSGTATGIAGNAAAAADSGTVAATAPAMASVPGTGASAAAGQEAASGGAGTGLQSRAGARAAAPADPGARAASGAAPANTAAATAGASLATAGTSPTATTSAVASAASPDTVLGSTTARAAGMSASAPATRATDLSAAGGAATAANAGAPASANAVAGSATTGGVGATGVTAVAGGGGLATFAQQAGAASTAMSGASTFLSSGVSANVGAAIVPVMTQALNSAGDRAAALGSAVDTLFTLPDVKQANIPAVAGAILSMPGLSSSAVPGVIGAILQSPTLATETLPKVAEVLMKIPGVADSPLPQIARDVLDTIGLGPVARTQGTHLPGDTPAAGDAGRVVPGVSTYRGRQDGARLQYVNLERADERWNDGNALTTTERQTRRPRIHVEFNRPGSHRFTITVKADPGNIAYSSRERGRRASYQEPHANPRSYVTDADGTRIVDDIALPAAGRNVYLFEVRDERGQLIKTERVETARRLYIQEVMCMSARPAAHLADVTPVTAEFALHGIDMIQLPRLRFRGRSAVDAADSPTAQQAIMDAVRRVYASSPGKQREPYTLVVCHVDRLAAPGTSGDMRLPVPAGPGGRVMTVPILNDDRTLASLWYEFDDGDDWLVHARYIHTDASGVERSIPIPRHLMTPVRESSGAVFSVTVDLTRISATPLRGMLNIQFNTVAASYAGLALTGTNLLFVSTLDPYEPNSQAYLTETLAHEMGHLLGMVPSGPDWPGLRDEDPSADDSKLDPPQHFYYNMGGHCYFGLPDQNGEYSDEIGQCVMYGITCANIHFCPSCSKAVRKVDCSEGWSSF
ncbi:MAG: hypothetical protein AB7E38_00180 [Achromobacter sp.]